MHIKSDHSYDAPPAKVHAMLTNPEFWQSLAQGRVDSCQASLTETGLKAKIGAPAPEQISAFTGATINVNLDASWLETDDGWAGPFTIDVDKMPASLVGTSTIAAKDAGTVVHYDGELTIRIPLVGKTLETKAAPYVMAIINDQEAVGQAWLASNS